MSEAHATFSGGIGRGAVLDCSEIIPAKLWIGGYVREYDIAELLEIGINSILNLQTDRDLIEYGIHPESLAQAYRQAGVEYYRLPIQDFNRSALAASLPAVVTQIEQALATDGAWLYLHCTAGVNRAATAAAGFLIRSQGLTARQACTRVMNLRNCSPVLEALELYEFSLSEKAAGS
jgi:protein tyrosine phosphatase (PTP) superfamily phosphohydrolase (DUF442 family)